METWASRISSQGVANPRELLAHPANWRRHSDEQKARFRELVSAVGFVRRVLVSERTKLIVNGHMRVEVAVEDEVEAVPVAWLDLTRSEELELLGEFDPLGLLAERDEQRWRDLLAATPQAATLLTGEVEERLGRMLNSPKPGVRLREEGPRSERKPRPISYYVYVPRELDVDGFREDVAVALDGFTGVEVGG